MGVSETSTVLTPMSCCFSGGIWSDGTSAVVFWEADGAVGSSLGSFSRHVGHTWH